MRSEKHSSYKKFKQKRLNHTILSVLIILSLGLGLFVGYYGSKVMSFLDNISVTDENPEDDEGFIEFSRKIEDLDPFSVLILGLDEEEGGDRRADTIMVATINPNSKDIKLVSIPRDMLVTLPNGIQEKVNAAYPTGGAILTRQMISDFLDIPIHFYASVDFEGLVELVDAVGGITVDSELEFTEGNAMNRSQTLHYDKGIQDLDGQHALGYARMRKQDPKGDFGRQERQQEVIIQLLKELESFNTVTNFTNILDAIGSHLTTNATTKQMLTIAANYSEAAKNIEQLTIEGDGGSTYFPHYGFEVYTWEPEYGSLIEVQEQLHNHLNKGTSSEEDEFDPDELDIDPQPQDSDNEEESEFEEN